MAGQESHLLYQEKNSMNSTGEGITDGRHSFPKDRRDMDGH